ncbi:MAG: hypothetical protein K2Q22_15955, partial [Cytophagales bacterium]|nr:hypothetical protein [Cytophagales bacterium]
QDFQVWETDLELFDESLKSFQENNANPIIRNWESMEIDTAAFDQDIQKFFELYDELVFENRKMFMDNHNNYVLDYNDEIKSIQLIYSRVEKISDFMESGELEENNPGNLPE